MAETRILVVDDEAPVRSVLVRLVRAMGYAVREAASAQAAVAALEDEPAELVLSDIHMPGRDGVSLLAEVRSRWPDTGVVMITGVTDARTAVRCLSEGALDYLGKPFQVEEAAARVRQSLDKRQLLLDNRAYRQNLEARVREQAARIQQLFVVSVQSLAHALEAKDAYTRGHSARVAFYTAAMGEAMALPAPYVQELRLGAELHDIGKIGVRESVLLKPGRLDADEYAHIKEHPVIGERILAPLLGERPVVQAVVRSHHERPDGRGFPDGLSGTAVPLAARIAAVADTFDAMTTARPYRRPRAMPDAVVELHACAGTQFDRDAVAAFARAFPDPTRLPVGDAEAHAALRSTAEASWR